MGVNFLYSEQRILIFLLENEVLRKVTERKE